ncbi:MAG: TRAP transporter permease [Deltaproteobacteria bacterium]|nr:TRAP transporter permease [Deltaproteobacteria bacterium]
MSEVIPVISEEVPATPPKTRVLKWTVSIIAVAMSLYHMYIAGFGPPEAMIFRGTHLLFTLTLVFLLYPLKPDGGTGWRVFDMVLLLASWAFILHIFLNYEYVTYRTIYIDDLTTLDKVYAVISVLIVLEATRRVLGWALPITAFVFIAYAVFLTNVKLPILMEQTYLSLEGIFGPTLGVSASYVMMFVLFGAFMERSGTGRLFMDFALAITGHTAGGPGKVSVISSALFGTVSGSAVANVMVDGPITIPLMKKTGFSPPFAAAVEAVASTGGQIMPPVMGAAAFVMAEFLAVSYFQVTLWAAIPSILYYVAVFFSVHFKAKRVGLLGVPKSELPRLGVVMRERGHLFMPIVVVFVMLVSGYSAPLCALAGTLTCLPMALVRKITRRDISWKSVIEALEDGARNTLLVAMACTCAGIVIGCVTLTGLGISFTQFVVGLAREMLPLALLLTAIAGIVLGMGMPTTPAYIVMVSLLVPALIKLGAIAPAAHMFAFYFAILSAITPPVALAVFAAASLAKTDLWKAGWEAVRIGAAGFIVPFMFVYEPSMLMIGDWQDVASSFITATIGTILLAASLQGYLIRSATMWQRAVLFVAALCLIKPGWISDLVGVALLAAVFAVQYLAKMREIKHETV